VKPWSESGLAAETWWPPWSRLRDQVQALADGDGAHGQLRHSPTLLDVCHQLREIIERSAYRHPPLLDDPAYPAVGLSVASACREDGVDKGSLYFSLPPRQRRAPLVGSTEGLRAVFDQGLDVTMRA